MDNLHILCVTAPDAEQRLLDYCRDEQVVLIEMRNNPVMSDTWSPFRGSRLAMVWREYYITSLAPHLRADTTSGGLRLVGNARKGIDSIVSRIVDSKQVIVLLCATEAHGRLVAGLVEREMAKRKAVNMEGSPA